MQNDTSFIIELLKSFGDSLLLGIAWIVDRRNRKIKSESELKVLRLQVQEKELDVNTQKKTADLDFYEKTIRNQDERLETIWRRLLDLEKTEVERQALITELRQQNDEYKSKINDLEDQLREFKIEMDDIIARLKQYEPDYQPTRKRKTKTT